MIKPSRFLRRPSPSMIVACLALFIAIGGTAIAARPLLTGADIQDGSLQAVDIQDDSLTGDDLVESTLAKVPSAGDADTLAGSTLSQVRSGIDADKLGGRTLAEVTAGTPFTTVSVPFWNGSTSPAPTADVITTPRFGTIHATCLAYGGVPYLRYTLDNTTSGDDRATVFAGTPSTGVASDVEAPPGSSTGARELGSGGFLYLKRVNWVTSAPPGTTPTIEVAVYEITVGPDPVNGSKCTAFVRKTTP